MTTINTSDEELLAMEIAYASLTQKFSEEGHSPYACAAIMTKLAFMIYKSMMSPEDYNLMIDSISDSRNDVKSFNELENSGMLN